MNWDYVRVSALMFLEFAIWGAWMPVLALRLLGPLKLNGKQTGWIYATLPLACIFAPFASGYLADKWFNAESIILVCHALGAIFLLLAARQTKFAGMFAAMLLYSICYTATLPLVNKVLFAHVPNLSAEVFLWAPVAWALVGYFLTGLRQLRKTGGDGPDSLYVAAILSGVMVLVALVQPATAPAIQAHSEINPMLQALGMLKNTHYLIFMLCQLAVIGTMQFYFLGTGQFMQDKGISGRNVSAAMGLAQAVQAAATFFLLNRLVERNGYQLTFIIGALSWTALYTTYLISRRTLWIVLCQAFHGFAYVFFVIGGQVFVGNTAPTEIGASAQSLLFIATSGIGLFLGTQLAGMVMQKNTVGGKFQWSEIWTVPLAITLAGAIVLAVLFKAPSKTEFQPENSPAPTNASVAGAR